MTIYTLISLVLAISGATYTATTAFRNAFSASVGAWEKASQEIWKDCADKLKPGQHKNGVWYRNGGIYGTFFWRYSHLVPITCFLLLAFGIAFWILGFPYFGRTSSDIEKLTVNEIWLSFVRAFLITNIVSFLFTVLGVCLIWSAHRHMDNIKTDADEDNTKGFEKKILLP